MSDNNQQPREHWGTRIGLILAMAGNAVGLGNFLRFPAKAAANGGGAFLVPYFIAFLILGIPLMWIEWGIGRYGGSLGHGTLPGVIRKMVKARWVKYLGVFGVLLPLFVGIYYNYIESWTMAFSYYSVKGDLFQMQGKDQLEKKAELGRFFNEFRGLIPQVKVAKAAGPDAPGKAAQFQNEKDVPAELLYSPKVHGDWNPLDAKLDQSKCPYQEVTLQHKYFPDCRVAYVFYLITFVVNMFFLYRGLSAGIEQLGKIGMPILFVFAIILAVRVVTLGQPEGSSWSVADGFNFLWIPKFSELGNAGVWLAAAGQIFFTLSLGMGSIQAYASYLSEKDDIVLTGLSTASLNEFAEVVLGGTIAIPAAVAFFGPENTIEIAKAGAFDLGFQTLPLIFGQINLGWLFAAIWFALLFIAGITSSVALLTPPIAFLKDELKYSHHQAVVLVGGLCFVCSQFVIFGLRHGVLDEMDYWAGTFGLVLIALFEVILFVWIFGLENAWKEIHNGADMEIPAFFKFVMKYLTPLYIIVIMLAWGIQDGWSTLVMANTPVASRPLIWFTRLLMLSLTALFMFFCWKRFKDEDQDSLAVPAGILALPFMVLIASYPGLLPIDTNALVLLVCAWSLVTGLSVFCITSLLSVPAKKHDDFPEEIGNDTTSGGA
jgi:SNF family Na+-dependent transporter